MFDVNFWNLFRCHNLQDMSLRAMWLQPQCLVLSLCLVVFTNSQGLTFFMNSTSEGSSCGHLQCVANVNLTGQFPFLSLAIYNETDFEDKVTLASVTENDPDKYLDHNVTDVINATGGVFQNRDGVLVELRLELDCRNGSFTCELAWINATGQSHVISRAVLP